MTERLTPIPIIAGPTAGGKARLAMAVARRTGATILSCDSMKVYRHMEVGTAKPGAESRSTYDWRGLDLADPEQDFDTARWVEEAGRQIAEARAERRPILISGGTALYIKGLTEGLFQGPGRDDALRDELRAEARERGLAELHAELARIDPKSATAIHPNDERRIVRALEVFRKTGRAISELQSQFNDPEAASRRALFFVRRPREEMDRRINERVDRMMAAGWLEECEALLDRSGELSRGPLQAIGYRQLFELIERRRAGAAPDLAAIVTTIKTRTRRFARRQLTWLKHFPDARVVELEGDELPEETLAELVKAVEIAAGS